MEKILIIQTAFIGDVILATAVAKKLAVSLPECRIHFLVRKGNEPLVKLPFVEKTMSWDKKHRKHANLLRLIRMVRKERYDRIVNLHRFISSGLITAFSLANQTYGFDKNPMSRLFDHRIKHQIGNGLHEVERNQKLIRTFTDAEATRPVLIPPDEAVKAVRPYIDKKYICIAPASVWYTKQFPEAKWTEFIQQLPGDLNIYMIGAPEDRVMADSIQKKCKAKAILNLCGALSLPESAALMQHAVMNYVNDSAPLHLAGAVNAPVRAVFCSTVPDFGFGPLSDNSRVFEIQRTLPCRPCNLHGKKECPIGTFECAYDIDTQVMAGELSAILKNQ